jgi:Ran GTPase-activating protein (RanGAP) involved in mRNA processing and transport
MFPEQYSRFQELCNELCANRKINFSELQLGPMLAGAIGNFVSTDRIARINLEKNSIGDEGVISLMNVIKFSKSLVVLNLSSNEITGDGMTVIFEAMGE